ncbi:MAG: histidine ammonia-lyase [Saccharothrix sp.]|nr:histidine ammonia-lyase [Saccharothrix sp.]
MTGVVTKDDLVVVGGEALDEDAVVAVARHGRRVVLADHVLPAMARSRRRLDEVADHRPVYGVSSGLGALSGTHVPVAQRERMQLHAIRSHAAGAGPEVETEVVRAMMVLRLRTLASGRTGVRPELATALAGLLNAGITPVVHEHGSLGCSGDLAPLAHVALALIGEGEVRDASGALVPASRALADAGLTPVRVAAKEGLALINGTEGMLGQLCLAAHDLAALFTVADLAAAMSVEALLGSPRAFLPEVQAVRPHEGQASSAANILRVLAGSGLVGADQDTARVTQDAYSLRCAPQVAGAGRDTLRHARHVARGELAATVDNPVLLDSGPIESNGNFHGAPLGYVMDFLAIAVADLAGISERRTDRLLDASRSKGLPAFLAHSPGLDSGYMIAHYTQAALVSDLKRLAVPASVDSIPTSAMQEDHVSMGWAAARKLRRAVDGLTTVLAIELLTAGRALDLRGRAALAPATASVVEALRRHVAGPGPDRPLAPEIESATRLVADGVLLAAAQVRTGPLD